MRLVNKTPFNPTLGNDITTEFLFQMLP